MTDLDVYQPAAVTGYQPGMVMTPDDARALDEQVRRCTAAVLREGTDYGIIPGTNGEKTLWRPGAQKLLQWFGLGYTCERVEVERDDDGRKHGITYKCTVAQRLPDGSLFTRATCEGTADYDESKFYQSEEQVRARLRDAEHKWAAKDRRVPNADRWNSAREWRADWHALVSRAQKRAIVGAVRDATAAGGIFSDREEDDSPAPQDDGPGWYEQALEQALSFTDIEAGRTLYVDAAQAHRDGLCTRRQQDHIQNRITQRVKLLKAAAPVDVEDLARPSAAAAEAEPDPTRPADPAATSTATGSSTAPAADGPSEANLEDQPGTVSKTQLTKLHTVLTALGFGGEDREQKLRITEVIAGRTPLTGPKPGRSSGNLSWTEARKVIDTLDGMDRDQLIAYMAEHDQTGDGDA
jgi:hypothetical protein